MKKIRAFGALIAALLASASAGAQSGYTTVTGAMANVCYNNGSIQAAWQNGNPSSPTLPTLNGSPFSKYVPTGIDANGNFTLNLADTAIVQPNSPSLSSWNITACAKGGSQPACYTALNVPVTGSSMNVTSYFSAATSACAGAGAITQLTKDVTAGPGQGSQPATVVGIEGTPFCSGFTPTNGQAVTYTTGGTPNPCWGAAASGGINQLTGDVTAGPGSGSQAATLATVNSSPGTCGDATHVCQVTTNGKGLVPSQTSIAITVGGGSTALQTYIKPPHTGQQVTIYPTTTSYQIGDPGTGSVVAGLTSNSASAFVTNGPGGGSLSNNTWGVTFGGFSVPAGVGTITEIDPVAISSNALENAFTYGFCTIGAGNIGLTPGGDHTSGADWTLQQFTGSTTWTGANVPSVNCTFQTQRTVTTSITSLYQVDAVALIIYYTGGSAPPANTAAQVELPLSYNATLNTLTYTGPSLVLSSDLVGSRAFGTTYQNNTGYQLRISGNGQGNTGSSTAALSCTVGPTNSPTNNIYSTSWGATTAGGFEGFVCDVPQNYWYVINVAGDIGLGGSSHWYENQQH